MTYPMTGDHKQKFYFGHKEILIPGKLLLFLAFSGFFQSWLLAF